ncbi:MAG: DUF6340 family protein [Mangrovibacterium sp.]
MKKNNLFLNISLLLITLSSCSSSYQSLVIETAHPSSMLLSNEIQSLTLIDRATTTDFATYNNQRLQQHFFDKKFNTEAVILDSLASDTTLKALGQLLYDSKAYDVVIPEKRHYPHVNKFYEIASPLSWEEVEQICSDYETDAVLALERFYNKVFARYEIYDNEYAVATIHSAYNVVANIYHAEKRKIYPQIIISDTISWQQGGVQSQEIFTNLPTIAESIQRTAIQAAMDIDEKVSPQWHREKRILFIVDNEDPKGTMAINLANQNEWLNLYGYWKGIESNSKGIKKSKTQYNLALASEMIGNIDEALVWIEKSIQNKYMQQSRNYMDILLNRQAEQASQGSK